MTYTVWRDEVVSRLTFTPLERYLKQWFIRNLSSDQAVEEAEKQRRNNLSYKERLKCVDRKI
jgi:hypothetical protein